MNDAKKHIPAEWKPLAYKVAAFDNFPTISTHLYRALAAIRDEQPDLASTEITSALSVIHETLKAACRAAGEAP